ncbi:MAG: Asp/Glu/hydantoin racemase, partial [Clostridiales bacterium]|nr:Asp/Glu/hydantoin racemase [Clostridiales bacterium]
FGLDQAQFKDRLQEAAPAIVEKVDVIVLAQGSMAYAEPDLTEKFHKPVLGSPRFGAAALKEALIRKGQM